jgi:hypothetical protein
MLQVRGSLHLQVDCGKLACPARLNAAAAGQLLYITDQQSGRRFLVDSGASVSLLPHSSRDPSSGPRLRGPDGAAIGCWGPQQVDLLLDGHRFSWQFLRAAVAFPILGLDFLAQQGFSLDAAAGQLVQTATGLVLSLNRRDSRPSASIIVDTSPALYPSPGIVTSPQVDRRLAAAPHPPPGS